MKIKTNEAECIDCKQCYKVCPMMKEYSSSPKLLMKQMIKDESKNKELAYSCMLCGICKQVCPKDIDLRNMFYEIRKDLFNNKSKNLRIKGYNMVKFHQVNSFSPLFSNNIKGVNTKTVFLPGCSLTSYSSDIVQKTFEYLREHINDISLLVKCCGKPTEAMGDIKKFEKYYYNLEKIFKEDNITEVIVACPNCFSTIKKYTSNVKVTSIWKVINKHNIPKELVNHYDDLNVSFTLHDPCSVRNETKIHKDVREILSTLGLKIEEFEKNRENSECCGSGGMVRVTNPKISKVQTLKRANEAKTDTVISYCESCCEAMLIANKRSLHVLDFLFNEDVINKNRFTQNKTSTINKWKERYRGTIINKSGRK